MTYDDFLVWLNLDTPPSKYWHDKSTEATKWNPQQLAEAMARVEFRRTQQHADIEFMKSIGIQWP